MIQWISGNPPQSWTMGSLNKGRFGVLDLRESVQNRQDYVSAQCLDMRRDIGKRIANFTKQNWTMSNLNKGRFPMADFGEFVQNRKIPKSNSVVFGQMEKIPAKNCIEFASGNLLHCKVFVRETGIAIDILLSVLFFTLLGHHSCCKRKLNL